MCGLVGVIGQITDKHEKAFRNLLVFDTVRGEHSTGVCSVGRHAQPLVTKVVGSPFELFETAGWDKATRRVNRVLLGHNRYATTGNVNRTNAHPFEFENIIGAHNGTLQGQHNLDEGNSFKVDSQALFNHIDKFGVQNAIDKVGGAWALTWWDRRDDTMNFLRNAQRPLYFAWAEDDRTVMWASEKWMLEAVADRHELKIKAPWLLKQDTLMTIKVAQAIQDLGPQTVVKEAASSYVPFVQPVTHWQGGNRVAHTNLTSSTSHSGATTQGLVSNNGTIHQIGGKPQVSSSAQTVAYLEEKKREKFSGSKGVKFRVAGHSVDNHGGRFVYCNPVDDDVENPVRLYVASIIECNEWQGKLLSADVGELYCNQKAGMYYKLINSSVKPLKEEAHAVKEVEEPEEDAPRTMRGPRGEEMTEEAWKKEFASCAWCTDPIQPTDKFRYVRGARDCLCEVCVSDPSLDQYVELV